MRRIYWFLIVLLILSCNRHGADSNSKIITVSIAPFKYFVEAIAGDDFQVNIMVPPGADPHIYEPFPDQVIKLRKSEAYISNGYLGFEAIWLDRFYETNRKMRKLSLGVSINPLVSEHHHEGDHTEGADSHYWVSPKCAMTMSLSVRDFLCELNPSHKDIYYANYQALILKIEDLDKKAQELFKGVTNKTFIIFHPNLGYLARDYGLEEITLEYEGKEPSPSRMKDLIDLGRERGITKVFVQREYDVKNAKALAQEIGAEIEIIDPLSEDWFNTTSDIINDLYSSLSGNTK